MEPGLWLNKYDEVGWCTHGSVWDLPWESVLVWQNVMKYGIKSRPGGSPTDPVSFVLPRAFLLTEDMCDG